MRDSIYNTFVMVLIAMVVIGLAYGLISLGKRWHAAEGCREDEAWVAVHHNTPMSFVDSHGVTRACVNIEELG